MRCPECKRDVDPSRDDAITCSNRCRQARFSRRHRKPRHPTRAAVNAFHRQLLGFLTGFEKRFAKWQAANPALDDEGKAALMQALYLTADGLVRRVGCIAEAGDLLKVSNMGMAHIAPIGSLVRGAARGARGRRSECYPVSNPIPGRKIKKPAAMGTPPWGSSS